MRKFRTPVVLCALLCLSLGTTVRGVEARLPTAAELFEKFLAANGGRSNIQGLKTVFVRGKIAEAEGEPLDFKLYRKRPDKFRMHLTVPGGAIDAIFDGKLGWNVQTPEGGAPSVQVLEGAMLEQMRLESGIDSPFFNLSGYLDDVASVGIEEVKGEPAIRLDIGPNVPSRYASIWISQTHYQEVKLLMRSDAEDPDQGSGEETVLSDFIQVEGVWAARKMETFQRGELVKWIQIEDVRVNLGVFDSFFTVQD